MTQDFESVPFKDHLALRVKLVPLEAYATIKRLVMSSPRGHGLRRKADRVTARFMEAVDGMDTARKVGRGGPLNPRSFMSATPKLACEMKLRLDSRAPGWYTMAAVRPARLSTPGALVRDLVRARAMEGGTPWR